MLNRDRVYMLAADHRWQWEEWCDANGVSRSRIPDTKELARRGFSLARDRSDAVREYGALLLDEQYSSSAIARARADGIDVGTPAEKAGSFPLEWASDPLSGALTGEFVKVLVRHRDDHPAATRDAQIEKLLHLQDWCRQAGKPLVVEVLVPRANEPEESFETSGRPAMLAGFVRESYRRGLTPEFWKIEGAAGTNGARTIDEAIRERPQCRQLILGKAADLKTIASWFAASRTSATASGFAIGRTVYWSPSIDFLFGRASESDAAGRICRNYLELIALWDEGAREAK